MPALVFNPITAQFDFVNEPGENEAVGITLLGLVNGSNTIFNTPEKFVHEVGGSSIRLYINGVRQQELQDYVVSESGGPGTGHDTVTVTRTKLPRSGDVVFADYIKA